MAHVQIFLSTVSAEFRSYRDALRRDLDRPNVTVKVQEDFIATGTETLDKLDEYIRLCDAVIHLVGDMTGALAQAPSVAVIRHRYPDLADRLPVLGPFLDPGAPALSYTQWEAWLALYHGKVLIVAAPQDGAPRDERYQLVEDQRAAQQAHLVRLEKVERYPEIRFANADRLAVDMLRSKLHDILALAGAVTKPANFPYLSEADSFRSEAQGRLDQALKQNEEWAFEDAGRLNEEAAELAAKAGDRTLEERARRRAIRAWHDHIHFSCRELEEVERTVPRIAAQLAAAETALDTASLAYERARLTLVGGDTATALEEAKTAADLCEDKTNLQWVDCLMLLLGLYERLGKYEEAVALANDVEAVRAHVSEPEPCLMVEALWLDVLRGAKRATEADVRTFVARAREQMAAHKSDDFRRLTTVLGGITNRFSQDGASAEVFVLGELGLDLAERRQSHATAASIAQQLAEVAAYRGEMEKVHLYLGKADTWAEKVRAASDGNWPTVQAMGLFARGRAFFWLAERDRSTARGLLEDAYAALDKAERVAMDRQAVVRGDLEIFLADLRWWRGRTAEALGRIDEAARLFREVHSDAAMVHPRFAAEVGSEARVAEAGMLCLMGRVDESLQRVEAVLGDTRTGPAARAHATELREMLVERVKPLLEWLTSPDAQRIAEDATRRSVRESVAEQQRLLIGWWTAWGEPEPSESNPQSVFLDMWGRGGFMRVAAAIRAKPHVAVAVDARSVEEIRRWARVLCPLFETVIVKWKGELGAGMVLAPAFLDLGEGDFGLHGYSLCLGSTLERRGKEWTVGMGWANLLPKEVGVFLAGEACGLIGAGRLLVLPAPLVGCTQSAVGWTDHMLLEAFLGGVVNVVGAGPLPSAQRVLDLSRASVPYIDGVSMGDLGLVLNDTEEWLRPLRALLFRSLQGDDLRRERWQAIAALENDIQDACRELRERLGDVARTRNWTIMESDASVAAASCGGDQGGREPITDLLRACTTARRDLAPWIPYWRLQGMGGRLDWTCPLDNLSTPPHEPRGAREIHTWLYPGTGGWLIPTVARQPAADG